MNGERSSARDRAIEAHLPLVRRLAHRFARRGEELDDLVQVGAVGLIKAVDRFDPSRGVALTSYAVPCIVGEIQRHLRDRAHVVRVPRRVQQDCRRLNGPQEHARIRARTTHGDEPAEHHGEPAGGMGTDDPIRRLISELSAARWAGTDDESEHATNRVAVRRALRRLDDRGRLIVRRRFFDDRNQDEIGLELGISQVQVSRLLRAYLDQLRVELDDRVVAGACERA